MSQAVSQGAITALNNLRSKAEAGTLTPQDVRAAMTSSQIYFAHLEETGFNELMDAKLKDPTFKARIVDLDPSPDELDVLRDRAAIPNGPSISSEEWRRIFSMSPSRRAMAFDSLAKIGIRGLQKRALAGLANLEARVSANSKRIALTATPEISSTNRGACCALLAEAEPDLCEWFSLQAIIFAAGCLLGCAPCCGAALAMELYAWLCRNGFLVF